MDLILMLVASFPIGWFVRQRLAAYVVYLSAFSLLFTYTSVSLITEWAGGDTSAFGSFPHASSGNVTGYGVVHLVGLVIGLGLIALAQYLRARRSSVVSPAPTPVAADY